MILIEDLYLTALVAQSIAIQKEPEFGAKGHSDGDERGDVERVGVVAAMGADIAQGFDDEDQRDTAHQEGVHDVADGLVRSERGSESGREREREREMRTSGKILC